MCFKGVRINLNAINEIKIDLLTKVVSVQNLKMHVINKSLSLHAKKTQPPTTKLSYVYTLFKFPGE